ncbi:MAG: hypothetical protein AAGG07_05695 [Planctomycetota bacterium]
MDASRRQDENNSFRVIACSIGSCAFGVRCSDPTGKVQPPLHGGHETHNDVRACRSCLLGERLGSFPFIEIASERKRFRRNSECGSARIDQIAVMGTTIPACSELADVTPAQTGG